MQGSFASEVFGLWLFGSNWPPAEVGGGGDLAALLVQDSGLPGWLSGHVSDGRLTLKDGATKE